MEQELKTFSLTLDMVRAMRSHPFEVVAGDTGNVLEVRLENDGVPVPLEGRYVCMVFRSGIGTALQDDDSGITLGEEEGTFSIALLPGSYGPGDVSADVQVYSGSDRKTLITSTRFTFRCRNALLNPETMRAQAAYPPLVAATREAEEAAEAARQAAARAVAATVAVGTVTTGAAGTAAAVVNSGTATAAVLNFTIPRGERGEQGEQGERGPAGPQGEPGSYETHAHGNVTNAGAIGTAAGRVVCTGEGGVLEAADAEEAAALLGVDGKAPLTHASRHAAGGADALTPAAIGAVAASEKGAAGGVATLNGSGTITGVQSCSPVVSVSDGDTIGIQQIGQTLRASPTSGETFTLTIQAGVFSVNDEFTVLLSGPGTVIVQGQENVQIRGANFSGAVEISTRYASVSFKKFVENANGEYFSVAGPGIGVATLDENGRLQAEQACSNVVEHYNITNYTMSTNDVGKAHLFTMPSGSQATMTITLPASLPVGTEFEMLKGNSGTTLVVSAGTGATISTINKSGQSSVRAGSGKFALITLKRYDQNWWFATGADE